MEVFLTKEDPGFDLIIGNPPYVRQEQILPPEDGEYLEFLLLPENKDEKAKVNKEYKEKLSEKVYKTYPFLNTKVKTKIEDKIKVVPVYGNKVPGRSDLYCYFQLLCPSYLNSNGTFCFIISNSWLDVEFGSFIQHFLLKHTKFYAVYDCDTRSFDAKVNTIIYIHSALNNITEKRESFYKNLKPIENKVKFFMNRIDYSQIAYAPILIEQENCHKNTFKDLFRVIVLSQDELLDSGYDEENAQYIGDKWGGKYLRAPEIYYTILAKGEEKLVRLGSLAKIKRGFTTGANDFFILDIEAQQKWAIEDEFLVPIIKSSRESKRIMFDKTTLENKLFQCGKTKDQLKGTNALKYIQYGENSAIWDGNPPSMRRTCSVRSLWYFVGVRESAIINCNYMIDSIMRFLYGEILVSDNFQEVHYSGEKINEFVYSCNSTLFQLFLNIIGRANFGDGLMKLQTSEVAGLVFLNPELISINSAKRKYFSSFISRELGSIYDELGFLKDIPIKEQIPRPISDRKELDEIVFDELGLSKDERNEVYWSVAELIKQRLEKAASR